MSIARFFRDLRRALCVTPHQAAAYLLTHPEVIDALETGNLSHLPAWPETARIVMAYAAWAGIDGRPVLSAIAGVVRQAATPAIPVTQPARTHDAGNTSSDRLRRAGSALKEGAIRLPMDALAQARRKPARALYALSLPVLALLYLLNGPLFHGVISSIPAAFVHMLKSGRDQLTVYWAPVRDGLRWIEVDDPRQRRGDKLQISHQSD